MPEVSARDIRVANFVFCEDVRPEAGNKVTILGAIAGNLNVPLTPVNIKVAFYGELFSQALGPFAVALVITVNGRETVRIEMNVVVTNAEDPIIVAIPAFPLMVQQAGQIVVSLDVGGRRKTIAKREVRVEPIVTISDASLSTAPQQQPERSHSSRKRKAPPP